MQPTLPSIERDPSESFERVEVDLGDDHLRTTSRYIWNALDRKVALLSPHVGQDTLDATIPNVGRQCGGATSVRVAGPSWVASNHPTRSSRSKTKTGNRCEQLHE